MGEPDESSTAEMETTKWRLTAEGKMFRKARQRYPNGDVYDGEWLDGKRHGRGVYAYRSGDKYVGEFANGMREGFGVFVGADTTEDERLVLRGRRYEGEWKNGRMEGRGLFVHGDGNSYDGDLNRANHMAEAFLRMRMEIDLMANLYVANGVAKVH